MTRGCIACALGASDSVLGNLDGHKAYDRRAQQFLAGIASEVFYPFTGVRSHARNRGATNRKIIQEVAKYAYEHEAVTGHFPKILIFAVNDIPHTSHADQLVRTCRTFFNQGDDFVKKITGNPNVDRPLQRIREFRNRPNPKIVVTVDMLSTGVDIPALEFIVVLRPVKSRILWEQMLGRGTRLCPDINKSKFVVFDCFDGTLIQYFRNVSSFDIEPPGRTPLTLPEVIENIWQKEISKVLRISTHGLHNNSNTMN